MWALTLVFLLACGSFTAFAQESSVAGNINGLVVDSTGAVIPGASVTLTGSTGNKTLQTDEQGVFTFAQLAPGSYSVKVERQGFRLADVKGVEVAINRTSSVRITLQPGSTSEVVNVSAEAVTVDTTSTAVGTNLSDNFYQAVPIQRNVSALFYAAPGVANGGATGNANPSISGGSGLENLYVADGVDITDTSFGGLGTYNRNFGSLGSGINLSFIKEVQVKTGGYEPQYGKSTGGIVQIVTKTGGNEFHGAVTGFFAPDALEAGRRHVDDYNLLNDFGKRIGETAYDASGEIGGYVPGLRNKLFFFGSFNPVWDSYLDTTPPQFGLAALGEQQLRINTYNYSGKLTFNLTPQHQIEASYFGDPAHTSTGDWRSLLVNNTSSMSKLTFGSRNLTAHYNGTLSPTWLASVGFSWMHNTFNENSASTFNGAPNFQINDFTQTAGLPGQLGTYRMQGIGFIEDTKSNNYGIDLNTSKVVHAAGEHTLSLGYKLELPRYDPFKDRSGGSFDIPTLNAEGNTYLTPAQQFVAGNQTNAQFQLVTLPDCTACPVLSIPGFATPQPVALQQIRGEFGPHTIVTSGQYHAVYGNDSWTMNKYVTLNAGLRWEDQRLVGEVLQYSFTDNWSPRIGISIDPRGDRKTKIYANFGRYDYAIPLDLAERSLSNELDFQNAYFAPAYTTAGGVNTVTLQNGTVSVVPDSAHLLNGVTGAGTGIPAAVSTSHQGTFSGEGIFPGTKMQYLDEFVVGGEHEAWGGVVISARYMDRRLKRIVEDTGGISPEAALAGVNQTFVIANPGPNTDIFTNPIPHTYPVGGAIPAACMDSAGKVPYNNAGVTDTFGNVLGAVCFSPLGSNLQAPGSDIPDGTPDGFPAPIRRYQAVEIEANKSFSKNWLMRANWRISKLYGNYEGAFRNDNGQSDPSISSLYDFTAGQFGLLGNQFTPGYLNTDRRHIVNAFVSYVVDRGFAKGLSLGTGINIQSGVPLNDLKAHPVYGNPGEVPVGGRGALGRSPVEGQVDLHTEYVHALTEKFRLHVGADLFNIANSKTQLTIDQNEDLTFGVANVDFMKPSTVGGLLTYQFRDSGFQRPFYARMMVKLEF
jgi:outer membrane receptor for ferrienterochelin and colicin